MKNENDTKKKEVAVQPVVRTTSLSPLSLEQLDAVVGGGNLRWGPHGP